MSHSPSLSSHDAEDGSQPRPLRLWHIFPLLFVCVYLTHYTLLRLPYYWDEAGYYIPAAYDFLRTGSLIPYSTLTNAHPPLPSIYLALWWKASGFIPEVTRIAMCIVSSLALLGVFQLSLKITCRLTIAAAVTVLTLLYPVWFAQSTLAHADMFAAATTIWAFSFYLRGEKIRGHLWMAALLFSVAALSKETAIVTPLALSMLEAFQAVRATGEKKKHLRIATFLIIPVLPLFGWYAYHRYRTGFFFGNPEYLRYNATSTLSVLRIVVALGHRIFHLAAHMNIFVPVLCALAACILPPRVARASSRPPLDRGILLRIWTVLTANAVFFSVLGGALLTRYLLPLYPLVLLLCVHTWYRRVQGWGLLFLLTAAAFVLGLFINPPYRFSPEDNLSYRDTIILDQQALRVVAVRYPLATVLTAWPVTDDLTKPELGYVTRPYPVVAIDDFSLKSIQRAGQSNLDYSVAIVFSTKYDPPQLPFSLGGKNRALDARFFNGHQDLSPETIAQALGGKVVWRNERHGQWAAVLHFDRPQLALLTP